MAKILNIPEYEDATKHIQEQIDNWVVQTLGAEYHQPQERAIRHLEECTEANQSLGVSRELAHFIVDSVYDRPAEDMVWKEIGGSFITLLGLAHACNVNAASALLNTFTKMQTPELIARCKERNAEKHHAWDPLPLPLPEKPKANSIQRFDLRHEDR